MSPTSFVVGGHGVRLAWVMCAFAVQCAQAALGASASPWAGIDLPARDQWTDIGDALEVGRLPMRVRAAMLPMDASRAEHAFTQMWPQPVMRRVTSDGVALSHVFDRRLVTVQLQRTDAPNETRALVALTDVDVADRARAPSLWPGIPAGSRIVTDMRSRDGAKASREIAYVNPAGLATNRDHVVMALTSQGLALRREASPPIERGAGDVMFFDGGGRQATAVVVRDGDHTLTVITWVERLERLP